MVDEDRENGVELRTADKVLAGDIISLPGHTYTRQVQSTERVSPYTVRFHFVDGTPWEGPTDFQFEVWDMTGRCPVCGQFEGDNGCVTPGCERF